MCEDREVVSRQVVSIARVFPEFDHGVDACLENHRAGFPRTPTPLRSFTQSPLRCSIRTDPDIVFCLTQPAASVNAVHFRDLAFGSVITHSPADAPLF